MWFGPASDAYGKLLKYVRPKKAMLTLPPGDATFTCAGNEMANSEAAFTSPWKVFSYEYAVVEPNGTATGNPVPHTIEMPAIFGPTSTYCTSCSYAEGQVNHPMVPIVMSYYVSFVKALNPNFYRLPSAPYWQPWGPRGNNRLRFVLDGTKMETVPRLQAQRCDLWKRLAPDMEQ